MDIDEKIYSKRDAYEYSIHLKEKAEHYLSATDELGCRMYGIFNCANYNFCAYRGLSPIEVEEYRQTKDIIPNQLELELEQPIDPEILKDAMEYRR